MKKIHFQCPDCKRFDISIMPHYCSCSFCQTEQIGTCSCGRIDDIDNFDTVTQEEYKKISGKK